VIEREVSDSRKRIEEILKDVAGTPALIEASEGSAVTTVESLDELA
jgi:hypothetical protein